MTTPPRTDETHDPALTSWVESANDPASDFPIQNLPVCCFLASHDGHSHLHLGVGIGDQVLDVSMLVEAGYFEHDRDGFDARLLTRPYWSAVLRTPQAWKPIRRSIQRFLRTDVHAGQQARRLRQKALHPIRQTVFSPPVPVFNYTDFYASVHHATNVGGMFRPDNPLLPNYKWVPIGYHGRASSLMVSGTPVRRPHGQTKPDDNAPPSFGPCSMLDYELEVGCIIGTGNELGGRVPISDARAQIFGLCLVNDWSARDVQKWEYQPLGPFLAKNFGTTVSNFVVTSDALEPFRCPAFKRPEGDPAPLPHLFDENDQASGGFDITLEVLLQSEQMEKAGTPPITLSRARSFREMYWTFAQMIAHHSSNGCNLQPGDLLASGTVSGPTPDSRGCLLELTWDGPGKPRRPIPLPTGEKRTFLADADTVIFRAWCERDGFRRIGFGECRGKVLPAE